MYLGFRQYLWGGVPFSSNKRLDYGVSWWVWRVLRQVSVWFFFVHTDMSPVNHPSYVYIRQFLQVCGVCTPTTKRARQQDHTLRKLFSRTQCLNKIPFTFKVGASWFTITLDSLYIHVLQQWNEFRQHEQLFTATPFTPVANSITNDTKTVINVLKRLQVTKQSIRASFTSSAANEVYKRAIRRLHYGHIDTESFAVMKAKTHDSTDILVLTTQVTVSLRCTHTSLTPLWAPYNMCLIIIITT